MKLLPHRLGAAAEKRVAKLTNSRRQPASGARWHSKSDLKNATHLTEVKSTKKKSYTLTLQALLKNEREALAAERAPSFVVEFDSPHGRHTFKVERL